MTDLKVNKYEEIIIQIEIELYGTDFSNSNPQVGTRKIACRRLDVSKMGATCAILLPLEGKVIEVV